MAKSKRVDGLGHPMQYDPYFNGPQKNRSCTDVLCLFIFLIFIGAWIGIGIYAFSEGDPNTLLVAKDSYGSRCGVDEHVKDKPYLFFFDLTKCLSPTVPFTGCPTLQVCVKKCPDYYYYWGAADSGKDPKFLICNYDVVIGSDADVEKGQCAKWYLPSSPFRNRCVPTMNDDLFEKIKGEFDNDINNIKTAINNVKLLSQAEQVGQNVVDDIINSWWKILIGVLLGVVACILYIILMRWIANIMVWISLLGVIALLAAGVYFTTIKYIEYRDHPVNNNDSSNVLESYTTKKDFWLVLLIIVSILLGIILLIIIFLRKRIVIAIALIKESSKAVSSVTSSLVFPIFPWILQVGVIAFAISVALFLATTGEPIYKVRNIETCVCTNPQGQRYVNDMQCHPSEFTNSCRNSCPSAICKFITMDTPAYYIYMQVINIFGLLWLAFFISALSQMILAMVFATWYWTLPKSRLPFFAVTQATLTTFSYHTGTLAFGSLIITICRAIRIVLEYIDHKLKKYDNAFTKAIMCCCKCFFWCLEKFLKFINRNAYIMCAIHGKNFCSSAKDAFLLLMRNMMRVWVLDKVSDFLFFLGKLLVTVGVGAVAYVIFATDLTSIDNSGLNYNFVPVIIIMLIIYIVSTIFFSVYSMAVDTIFLCFLEDCERNDGSPDKPYRMSKNLMNILGKKNKTA